MIRNNDGQEFRVNRPEGLEYWQLLHDVISAETVEDRDRVMLGTLRNLPNPLIARTRG